MSISEQICFSNIKAAAQAFLHDRIVQIVSETRGVKEIDLTLDIMCDIEDRDQFADPAVRGISVEIIFVEIHRLIQAGRIVGIDCEIGDAGYTFLVPAGTKLRVAMPVHEIATRH